MRQWTMVAAAIGISLLAGCKWFEGKDLNKLPGTREAVLGEDSGVEADTQIAALPVRLPRPWVNPDWAQPGGDPSHAMQHLALPDSLKLAWSKKIGKPDGDDTPLLAQPIVAGGRIFVMDGRTRVIALDAATGKEYWHIDLHSGIEDAEFVGGGIAYAGGRLFVSTPYAKVFALDPASGKILWTQTLANPMRAAPTVSGDRVYVLSVDNTLEALSAADGSKLWSHSGIQEQSTILGGASPAAAQDIVVVAYSSGEVYAIREVNGRALWSDTVANISPADPMTNLADIRAFPIIEGEQVIAFGHSGRIAALSLQTGRRLWSQNVGGIQNPWLAGNFVYAISNEGILVCITRGTGRIRWTTQLARRRADAGKDTLPLVWVGPILAGNRLIVVSSDGEAGSISPYTGKVLGALKLPGPVSVPPIVANNTLYILTDEAELLAYR